MNINKYNNIKEILVRQENANNNDKITIKLISMRDSNVVGRVL